MSETSSSSGAVSLLELNRRVAAVVSGAEGLRDVWVTAELSDVRIKPGGHCYLELVDKNPSGAIVAKARATIWHYHASRVRSRFCAVTGRDLASDIKVMVRVTASFHPEYGFAYTISDIEPSYTVGDLMRRRAESIARLQAEGLYDLNRSLPWATVPQRVAIISARDAAGYRDFVTHLIGNERRLRFTAQLYPALMQGDSAAASIMAALERVKADRHRWDCVVIMRGGGATTDFIAFENYDLAGAIASFPLPVIVAIGHERDITLLDYVAAAYVKTPTAAADLLLNRGIRVLDAFATRAHALHVGATERLGAARQHLAAVEALLPTAPVTAIERAAGRLSQALLALSQVSARRIAPELARLDHIAAALPSAAEALISRSAERLDQRQRLLEVLSPAATLARGYSITRIDGHAITSAAQARPGTTLTTELAHGTLTSTVP